MIQILKLTPEHKVLFSEESTNYKLLISPLYDASMFIVAILEEGKMLATAALIMSDYGVGELHASISDEFKARPKTLVKVSREVILFFQKYCCLHRIQSTVVLADAWGARWMQALKFEYEGNMKQYDDQKRDYARYARVF